MIIKGRLAELLVNINPKLYRKYIVINEGANVLYVKLQKELHELLRSVLVFYLKLAADVKAMD